MDDQTLAKILDDHKWGKVSLSEAITQIQDSQSEPSPFQFSFNGDVYTLHAVCITPDQLNCAIDECLRRNKPVEVLFLAGDMMMCYGTITNFSLPSATFTLRTAIDCAWTWVLRPEDLILVVEKNVP